MGIGGLDDEFSTIFRRAFSSRLLPAGLIDQMGIPHVKGMLLYGPPGTGKTLIARQIGKMLNAREPKIINGPEILNKFVGQSEENVRKMFADAEKEYKEKGEESGLHIIIFDELDAVCKQRGSGAGGGTGVGDSVVNQLLTKLDGVEQLNNILLIGMTNRKDMIDDALLRPGRLEVHVEISLPDEHGRSQIFKIHTQKMRSNGRLEDDVNIPELAARTKNFSGAEINGLVKAASSYAFTRQVKVGELSGPQVDYDSIKVNMEDFLRALDDVKPAFGVAEEDLEKAATHGIIRFSPHIERIQKDGQFFAAQISHSEDEPVFSVLLHGPKGSGKTALAADIGLKSGFPFVKLVSAQDMISMGEQAKIDHLRRIFNDSYKSPVSMIILDRIEMMIEWSPIGPRFQNSVLIAIAVLMAAKPPRNRRLLTVGTTSERSVLQQLSVLSFDRELAVPAVTDHRQLQVLLEAKGYRDPAEINEVMYELQNAIGSERIDLGVAVVLRTLGTAQLKASRDQTRSFANYFANELADVINTTLR
jgi:vesicle-fusing ATPase